MVTPVQVNEQKYAIHAYPCGFLKKQLDELVRARWYDAPINEVGTVIDLGANIGLYSLYMSEFAKKVHAVECYSPTFEYLLKNIAENKKDNIVPHKFAVAGDKGERYLYSSFVPSDVSAYSLLPVGDKVEKIKTKTLAQFIKEEKIDTVHILKTDIEGLEQEVFSADDFGDVAKHILCIVGEYHIQCKNLAEVLDYHGFTFSVNPRGMFTAIKRVKKEDIILS